MANRATVRARVANTWATQDEKDYLLALIDADIEKTPLAEDEVHEQ